MRPSNLAVITLTAGEKWSGDTQSACKSASISSRLNSINHRGHCRARRVRRPSALAVAKVCNRAHNQGRVSSYSLRPKQGFDQQIVYVIWNLPAELLPKQHFHVACGQVTVLPKKFGKSRICFAHRSTPRRGSTHLGSIFPTPGQIFFLPRRPTTEGLSDIRKPCLWSPTPVATCLPPNSHVTGEARGSLPRDGAG